MTETKWTKGPYKAYATGLARSGKPEYEIHWSEDGECVAEIVHGKPEAHLIAAAPDMADALRQWQHAEETGDETELANARVSRDKALAKARGKS